MSNPSSANLSAESLQTRTEHSRSLEDAEKYKALQTLTELGLLVPVAELETFHGRLGEGDEGSEWTIDPTFANGSNDSGNSNVNARPTLYTGDKTIATEFADQRVKEEVWTVYMKEFTDRVRGYTPEERQKWLDRINQEKRAKWAEMTPDQRKWYQSAADGGPIPLAADALDTHLVLRQEAVKLEKSQTPEDRQKAWDEAAKRYQTEVHEIVTPDTDAVVIDFNFDISKLNDLDRQKYSQALSALAIPVTKGSPVSFKNRDAVVPFGEALSKLNKRRQVLSSEVAEIAAEAGIDEGVALQLASAYNAHRIALINPAYLAGKLVSHSKDIVIVNIEVDGQRQELPINLEYVQRFMREAHIVGVKQTVNSTTIDKRITAVSFFDLEKTTTKEQLDKQRQTTWKNLGELAGGLGTLSLPEENAGLPSLLRMLEDVHVKPGKLVEAAKKIDGYNDIFEADAGNWEGFTLAEHTETVLRNFDENFAENLPVELLAPMRLAILAHDVGKPLAASQGNKAKQMEYNLSQAEDFLTKAGVPDNLKNLLLAIIGPGEELVYQIAIRKAGEPAEMAMRTLAEQSLRRYYNSDNISENQYQAFTEMCRMLQICDGGAYTSMAVTTRANQGSYRNAPSFNDSFAQPIGFGKRGLRLRGADEAPADRDLTPQDVEALSKIKISRPGPGRRPPKL